jgi:hypothetical protein
MIELNPIYQRIRRTTGKLWLGAIYVLAGVTALYCATNVLALVTLLMDRGMSEPIRWLLFTNWILLLLLPAVPAGIAAALTAEHAASDEYELLRLTKIMPYEIVEGYYEAVRQRIAPVMRLVLFTLGLFGLLPLLSGRDLLMVLHPAFMIIYILMVTRVAMAFGVWAGLRYRNLATALAVTTAGVLGLPLGLTFCSGLTAGSLGLAFGLPACLSCISVVAAIGLQPYLLKEAERRV